MESVSITKFQELDRLSNKEGWITGGPVMCTVHTSSLMGCCLSWCVRNINYVFKLEHVLILVFVMIWLLYNYLKQY